LADRGHALRGLAGALLLLWGVAPASAQLSPGPLARPHAALEGTLKCTQCHAGRKEAMARACLQCHREIAALAARNRGFHTGERSGACASCHPDHAGRDFAMVSWPEGAPERFDHRRAGWALEQSHAEARCTACHAAKYRTSPLAALAPPPGGRWTGLETGCTACHEDVHRGELDRDCTTCHDAGAWEKAPGFDHDRTRYRLTGAHDTVSCDGCHLPKRPGVAPASATPPRPVYRDLAFGECSSCHADPHAGRFGGKCATCHVTSDFRRIDRDNFDHERTRYPLRGEHAVVACAKCHAPGEAGRRPPFEACASCHRADPHAGTATLAGRTADCGACHTVRGWTPGVMTPADHARSRYPLEGRHRQVACAGCHRQLPASAPGAAALGSARVQLRPAFTACRDCHADDHGGQLATRRDQGACEGCHQVAGWTPSTFGRAEHAGLRLALDGRHAEARCADCHAAAPKDLPAARDVASLGKARVAVRLPSAECTACHVDVHRGRYAAGGARAGKDGCAACHDARAFRPSTMTPAAHAPGVFPLDGGHRATPCVACHADLERRSGGSFLLLAKSPASAPLTLEVPRRACADCHARQDPHGDQFGARADRGACEACHTAAAFVPADRFDHDRDAAFALAGAHARVRCAQCHVPAAGAPRGAVRYRPLSARCESCHDATTGSETGGKRP
jgi:hypothetical protein